MTSENRCPECGAPVPPGLESCQPLWDELSVSFYAQPALVGNRDLAFDAYCMQHPETYCRSAKSYAAHLMRLCCGLEHNAEPEIYEAIRRWLDGKVNLQKPPVLAQRGTLTLLHVQNVQPDFFAERTLEWASDVWGAYSSQQDLARTWVEIAISANRNYRS